MEQALKPIAPLVVSLLLITTQVLHGQSPGSAPFCGEIVKGASAISSGGPADFHDRFGNSFTYAELDGTSYPNDGFMEDCNSGIFTLQFGLEGSAPAWTMEEMSTVCSVFHYLSGLVSTAPPSSNILIRVVKDANCGSAAAATPFWDAECGIANSLVFNQIVSGESNYPPGFIAGLICIQPDINWHTLSEDCSPSNPCIGTNEVDLYTGMLHEALHIVGFASRIGLSGTPLNGGYYSRWDRFLRSGNQNAYLLTPQNDPDCCDQHVFNSQQFPNMPTPLSGDCSMNVFFFDGTKNVAEVNNDQINPTVDIQMANKLSHLDNNCNPGFNFVINPELPAGTYNRVLSAPEVAILCNLGYQGSGCRNECATVANNDGPYTLILAQGSSINITAAELLVNDLYPQNFTLSQCGNDPEITVTLNNNVFTVTGNQEGIFHFCYTVSGCQGWCDEAEVTVIVRQETIPLACENPDCNLVCFGDFEAFEPIFDSYYTQLGSPTTSFVNATPGAESDPCREIDNNGNMVMLINWSIAFPDNTRKIMTVPLSRPIQPGCTAAINFDAVGAITQGQPDNPTIQVYGLTGYPCPLIEVPNCATDPFTLCNGVTGYCLTSTTCSNSAFGCTLPIDSDVTISNGDGIVQNLDLSHFSLTWENNSNEDITHLIFFPNTVAGNMPNGSRIYIPIDNVEVFSDCSSNISIETAPNPLLLCIGGAESATTVSVQLTGDGSQPVQVDLHAGPLPPGLSFSGGDFNANGQAQVTLTPNGPAQTLTLSLVAASNWTPGTVLEIPISASSDDYCFNPNQDGAILQVILEDCEGLLCPCPDTLYNLTGTTILSESELPQNGLDEVCLAIAGTLVIDANIPNATCDIRMQPGSSIVVNSGATLNITGGNIHGCTQLWKSITVYGTLNLNGVIVEDAEYAVHLKLGAAVSLIGNTLRKNFTSIYYRENGDFFPVFTAFRSNNIHCENLTFLPPYPGQQTLSGTLSYAGVDLNFLAGGVNIGNGNNSQLNDFHHLQNGILINSSTLTVRSSRFSNIPVNQEYAIRGYGIYGVRSNLTQRGLGLNLNNPTFDQVYRGIWVDNSRLDARFSAFRDVWTGIRAGNSNYRNVIVQSNLIYADGIGINLYQNQLANQVDCEYNYVWVDFEANDELAKGVGIWVNDLDKFASGTPKSVSHNYLYTNGPNIGVRLNSAYRYLVMDNILSFNNPNTVSGIVLEGNLETTLSCNQVTGAGTAGSGAESTGNTAYSVAQSTGSTYRCNSSANVRSGFRFSGFCGSSANAAPEFRGNLFNTAHRRGLWMTNSASFGTFGANSEQVHKGNQWSGSFSGGTRAIHQGTLPLVNLSKFKVHTTALPWYPEGWVANGPWFELTEGSPNPCNLTTDCPIVWFTGEGDTIGEFGRKVAEGLLELPEAYASGLGWEMERALYRKLEDNQALINQDPILEAFYQNNQQTALGKLIGVERSVEAYTSGIENTTVQALIGKGLDIDLALDSMVYLEGSLPENPTDAQLAELANAKRQMSALIGALETGRQDTIDVLQGALNESAAGQVTVNNSISTSEDYEWNRQVVNIIALNKVVRGSAAFNSMEVSLLQQVAEQCPITGGNAVYEARSMLAYAGEMVVYDDSTACDSATLVTERHAPTPPPVILPDLEEEGYRLSVAPNPAGDYLRIQYTAPSADADLSIQLISPAGTVMRDIRLTGTQDAIQISLTDVPSGLYYLRFSDRGKTIATQKIMIAH